MEHKYTVSIDDLRVINDRRDIPILLKKMNAEKICEIGVKEGANFTTLLVPCIKKAVAIDIWAETGLISQNDDSLPVHKLDLHYQNMVSLSKRDQRVEVIKDFSPAVSSKFEDNFFDFVYIDADHTEEAVYLDLKAWWPKVRLGGVLAGHDYVNVTLTCGVKFGVIESVDRFVKENNLLLHVDQEMPWRDWFILKP